VIISVSSSLTSSSALAAAKQQMPFHTTDLRSVIIRRPSPKGSQGATGAGTILGRFLPYFPDAAVVLVLALTVGFRV